MKKPMIKCPDLVTNSVYADVMFAVSLGRFKPRKHLNMGLGIKSMTGSRKVLGVLNHMGHSISYHTAKEIETVLVNVISTRQSPWFGNSIGLEQL